MSTMAVYRNRGCCEAAQVQQVDWQGYRGAAARGRGRKKCPSWARLRVHEPCAVSQNRTLEGCMSRQSATMAIASSPASAPACRPGTASLHAHSLGRGLAYPGGACLGTSCRAACTPLVSSSSAEHGARAVRRGRDIQHLCTVLWVQMQLPLHSRSCACVNYCKCLFFVPGAPHS